MLGGQQQEIVPIPHAVEVDKEVLPRPLNMALFKGGSPQQVPLVVVQKYQAHPLIVGHLLCDGQQGQHPGGIAVGVIFIGRAIGGRRQSRHRQNQEQRQHQLRLAEGEADRQRRQERSHYQRQRHHQMVGHMGGHVGGRDEVRRQHPGRRVVVGTQEQRRPVRVPGHYVYAAVCPAVGLLLRPPARPLQLPQKPFPTFRLLRGRLAHWVDRQQVFL